MSKAHPTDEEFFAQMDKLSKALHDACDAARQAQAAADRAHQRAATASRAMTNYVATVAASGPIPKRSRSMIWPAKAAT